MMRSKLLIFSLVAVVLVAGVLLSATGKISSQDTQRPLSATEDIQLGEQMLQVAIADEAAEQIKGLSGISSIENDEGMLFVYNTSRTPSFWMKDMRFAIDIIWIDKNREVVGVEHAVTPNTYPQTFSPPGPVQYVLEVNAGWAEGNNIQPKDKMEIDS